MTEAAARPTTVQEAREANGTASEARAVCDFWWVTADHQVYVANMAVPGDYRRTHSCIRPLDVGDGEHHWGPHQCADHDCDEATSLDVFDPES